MSRLKLKRSADPAATGQRPVLRSIDGRGESAAIPAVEAAIPAVEVAQLRKTYPGGVEAVKGIDFAVAPGEVFGLLGPNGAGKSTTIGMLTTTVRPSSGSARLAGYDVATQPLLARSVSSVVFQDAVVDGALSGRANLELHARLWGVKADHAIRQIAELVESVGLTELIDRPVDSYSGGQRRRWRSRARSCQRRGCCFSMSPPWAWTPGFATSCST